MSDIPVLWLCGAPGVGKSTVAWVLYRLLSVRDACTAYVDIDQLGMLLPVPRADPDRHQVKTEALAGVVANAQAAGAGAVIVSGVLDAQRGADVAREHPNITFCRLSVAPEILGVRLAARGWPPAEIARALDELAELSAATFVQHALEGSDRAPQDLAQAAAAMITAATGALVASPPTVDRAPAGHGSLITGPRAVGKSTVSWLVFMRSATRTVTGYLDLDQLGFISDAVGRDHFRTANLAAVWRVFHAAGATRLIINGQLTGDALADLRQSASGLDLEVVGLVADELGYRRRIAARHAGGPAELAGDDLLGADPEHQARALSSALREDAALRACRWVDRLLDTSDLTAVEAADALDV